MNDSDLKTLQDVEFQIMKDFDYYCTERGIDYSLSGGTMLGAVRHQGFIPWDDDIDAVMTRDNFEQFMDAWSKEPMEGHTMQNPMTDYKCGFNHTKIRKNGTMFLDDNEEERGNLSGIWLDLFVLDKVDNTPEALDYMKKVARKRFAITRGYAISRRDGFKEKTMKTALRLFYGKNNIPAKFKETEFALQRYRNTENEYIWIDTQTETELSRLVPENIPLEYIRIPFCDGEYKVFKEYDTLLRIKYGDYMQMPPEEERICVHNPKKLIFG